MDDNDFNESKKILEKHGVRLNFSKGSNLSQILKSPPEEIEKIIEFCNERGLSFNAFSCVWLRTYEELKEIVEFVTLENIPISNSLFLRTPDEIRKIVGLFRDNGIDITYRDDIFKHSFSDINKTIEFCLKNGIDFKDKKIFDHLSFEAIEQAYAFCKNNNLDFSCYLGSEDESSFWILYNGNRYLMSKDGETLLRCFCNSDGLTIPSFVKNIADGAFNCNNSLIGITIPATVRYVGNNAFQNCSKLSTVSFEGELLEIKEGTFENCTSLRTFIWPKGVKKIGNSAFKRTQIGNLSKYKNHINFTFPDSIEEIGDSAFEGCANIETFDAPSNLKKVGNNAFRNCENLVYVMLPSGVTYFDPKFASNSVRYVCYDDWFVPIVKSGQRIGYSNYVEVAENIYDACVEGLKKLEKDNVPAFKVLPMYRSITNGSDFEKTYIKELCEIIARCPKKEVYSKVFSKFSDVHYVENVRYLVETLGVDKSGLSDLIVTGNNYNLLGISHKECKKNFEYLRKQKIISYNNLKKLFFEDIDGNDFDDMVKKYYDKYKCFPPLYNSLLVESNDKNKLELRDRLVYISTMQLLDDNYSDDRLDEAISMMGRTLFENVIDDDKLKMSRKYRDLYSIIEFRYPEMMGIMCSLYEKMNGIDSKWFKQLMLEMRNGNANSAFSKFYQSLETIKNWNQFDDEIVRATYLKNEIVGRLLYADINLICKKKISVKDYIRDKADSNLNGSSKTFAELLEYASKDKGELFRGNSVTTLLTIDPYAFDALRYSPSYNGPVSIQYAKRALVAKRAGYMFSQEELAMYKLLYSHDDFDDVPTIDCYAESVINSIGIPKIPVEKRKEYLDYMKNMSRVYIQNQSEADLFKFCRSLDLYLRNNNEYVTQGEESEKVAKTVFDIDGGIDNDSRVLYCLYNLNRIAHGTLELNVNAALVNKFRVVTEGKITYERMEDIFDSYNILYRYGLNEESINYLLGKGVHRSISDLILKEDSLLSVDELTRVNEQIKESVDLNVRSKSLNDNDVKLIRKNLKFISMMKEEEEKIISTSVKERGTFFECKRIFSIEVMKRIASEFSSDFKEMLEASLDKKQEFYAKHGYVAEVQDTPGGPTLVCLCEKFREPFSIHLKDLPDNIATALNTASRTETIAHGSLRGNGLTLRDANYESDLSNITEPIYVGFKVTNGLEFLPAAMKSNFQNYDVPAKRIRAAMARDNSRSELEGMLSEGTNNASGANTNTGGNKHQ